MTYEQLEQQNRILKSTLDLVIFTVLSEEQAPACLVERLETIIEDVFPNAPRP